MLQFDDTPPCLGGETTPAFGMATIAVYSPKGGVGKTTLAVNLAWSASVLSSRKVLLWDLDGQAAATYILTRDRRAHDEAKAVLEKDVDPHKLIVRTEYERIDLLPADQSIRGLDALFDTIDRKKRLLKLTESLRRAYDHVVLDCPPGLGSASDQIIRGASIILVPMIPSTLSRRTLEELKAHLNQHYKGGPPLFPIFNLVDRRRRAHREAIEQNPGFPVIPMASAAEEMADRHAPLGAYAPRSAAAEATNGLWLTLARRLAAEPAAAG